MSINLKIPDIRELKPRITVFGVGGAGGNAVNNMIEAGLEGVDFVVANTDAQALDVLQDRAPHPAWRAGHAGPRRRRPPRCRHAPRPKKSIDEIGEHLDGAHMVFITAGMGGGTGTGAAPDHRQVRARARHPHGRRGDQAVPLRGPPPHAAGRRRHQRAAALVDTLIVIPNQNLFRVANEKTTFADAFAHGRPGAAIRASPASPT